MSFPSLDDIRPYLELVTAGAAAATLGFVLNLANAFRDAAADRASVQEERSKVLEERLRAIQEELQRTEKWEQREKAHLTNQNAELKRQLEELLVNSGINILSVTTSGAVAQLRSEIRESILQVLSRMQAAEIATGDIANPSWHLELAKGFMATGDWDKAAAHFDRYVGADPLNWEAQFSRAVAYANARSDNVQTLRAISEAIALAPDGLEKNLRARMFDYKGAILKRLGRLDEAGSDLRLAERLATREYEVRDIKYNLAAVFAMTGDRTNLMKTLRELRGCSAQLEQIRGHLDDYFKAFKTDPEFLQEVWNESARQSTTGPPHT